MVSFDASVLVAYGMKREKGRDEIGVRDAVPERRPQPKLRTR